MAHSYIDDIAQKVLKYLERNHQRAVQTTSGVPLVSHIQNCYDILKQCGWNDHCQWQPMLELCRLENLDEEKTWRKFAWSYKNRHHDREQRDQFGRFFRRCQYLAKAPAALKPETFYWLAGRWQNEAWGILMADAMAVADELKAAGRLDEARECLRQSAPLYLVKSRFIFYDVPADQQPTDEELKTAEHVLTLTDAEQSAIIYNDDLYRFDETCTGAPRGAWLKRWHDLGGMDFWN